MENTTQKPAEGLMLELVDSICKHAIAPQKKGTRGRDVLLTAQG